MAITVGATVPATDARWAHVFKAGEEVPVYRGSRALISAGNQTV